MRRFWHRYAGSLTSGVRTILIVMAAAYIASWVGRVLNAYDLRRWLALNPAAFGVGRVWTVVTYVLVPAGPMDLIFNLLLISWLGPCLETMWSRWELWTYCLLTAVAGGATKLLLARFDPTLLIGAMPMVCGLVVAWMRLRGHERVQAWLLGETTVLLMGLIMLAAWAVFLWLNAGLISAVIVLAAALCGSLYLSLRWKLNRDQPGHQVESQRMRRLEL
jgi:membrane associated rhomboid family serine protease